MRTVSRIVVVVGLVWLYGCGLAHASVQSVPDKLAVSIILGEAANQGPAGMQAVGEVLRRVGPSKFSTLKRKDLKQFIARQPQWVHRIAQKAWENSAKSDLSRGATHYENVKAFGRPRWARNMVETTRIKDHVFFKERESQ